jgi:ADP-heptose:LPS heptosyltransferase
VFSTDNLGNYAVLAPALPALRRRYEGVSIAYFTKERILDLVRHDDRLATVRTVDEVLESKFDLVVNMEQQAPFPAAAGKVAKAAAVVGPILVEGQPVPFGDGPLGQLWADADWASADLPRRHPILPSGFIGDILMRSFGLSDCWSPPTFPEREPTSELPRAWMAATAGRVDKLWHESGWTEITTWLKTVFGRVGLTGAAPGVGGYAGEDHEEACLRAGAEDWRGKLSLREVAWVLKRAEAFLTLDSGLMHLAAAGNARTVAIFRPRIVNLWRPPIPTLAAVTAPEGGQTREITVEEVRRAWSSLGLD